MDLQNNYEINLAILQMRKLRHRQSRWVTFLRSIKLQNQSLNPGVPALWAVHLTIVYYCVLYKIDLLPC